MYWPNGGHVLDYLRTPALFAVLLGGIGLAIGAAFIARQNDREERSDED